MRAARIAVLGFCAGFLAVLIFHQGVILLMYGGGLVPNPPFPMRPVPPFGVPQIVSMAFWGGVWGILIGAIAAARPNWPTVLIGLAVGAIGCVLVGFTLVAALRGQPLFGGMDPARWWRSVVINGAFGLGAGLIFDALRRIGRV